MRFMDVIGSARLRGVRSAAIAVSATLVTLLGCTGVAAAGHRSPRPIRVAPHWTEFPDSLQVMTTRRYAFLLDGGRLSSGTLLDDQTGSSRPLQVPAGCNAVMTGGPWLLDHCGQDPSATWTLQNLTTGDTEPFAFSPSVSRPSACGRTDCFVEGAAAIGADWIVVSEGETNGRDGGPSFYAFQNLQTGAALADPSDAHTIADLGSPTLARPLCPRSTRPTWRSGDASGFPFVRRLGHGFVLARRLDGTDVERCGTKLGVGVLQRTQQFNPVVTPHLIAWDMYDGDIAGVFLPSLRRFLIPSPARIAERLLVDRGGTLAVTDHAIYLSAPGTRVWRAPLPAAPPSVGAAGSRAASVAARSPRRRGRQTRRY
jgi:hypothetical protein